MAVVEAAAESVGGHESSDVPTIIPARALTVIERALGDAEGDCQVAARGSDVLVKSDKATIYSRLVEGRFPRWRDVFPRRDGASKVELNVGPFLSTVRQAAIVTGDESRGVDFTFADGLLTLAARGKDVGQSRVELPIAYAGDKVTITLDPRYVVDFLRVVDLDKTVTVEFSDSDGPAVFNAEGGYRYVIMPLSRE
jgi:DNA polymerase-3 subunit beta